MNSTSPKNVPEEWRIANDSPAWLKGRTVWFIVRGRTEILCDKAGRRRFFSSRDAAARALWKLSA